MSDQFSMFDQKTPEDTSNVISSLASAAGRMRSGLRDGPMTDQSGPPVSPASRGQRRARAGAWTTKDTYGPLFTRSSPSASLGQSLASRLKQRLNLDGSMEFSLTLSEPVTPAGRQYFLLRASGRRTSGRGYSGWPTPRDQDHKHGSATDYELSRNAGLDLLHVAAARMAGWPSPRPSTRDDAMSLKADTALRRIDKFGFKGRLEEAVAMTLSGVSDAESKATTTNPANTIQRGAARLKLMKTLSALVAGWNTPRATDGENGGPNQAGGVLAHDASLAGWATPLGREWKDSEGMQTEATNPDGTKRERLDTWTRQAIGAIQPSSTVGTGSGGASRLNALFSLWLQGYPPAEWASCAVRAIASCRKSRRNLSKPISK